MEWLDPWWSTENHTVQFHESFRKQLEREVPPGHGMYQVPATVIARGNGDDALFQILDGSNRVADVHLTWAGGRAKLPWPITTIYCNLDEWVERVMKQEHREWAGDD